MGIEAMGRRVDPWIPAFAGMTRTGTRELKYAALLHEATSHKNRPSSLCRIQFA